MKTDDLSPSRILKSLARSVIALVLLSGCGGTDSRFVAESYDEYTEPLVDAIIGTPNGVIVVASPGEGADGGAGTGGSAGAVAGSDAGDGSGFGSWHFDDCSPSSHFLSDSSAFGANAQQALTAACVPGASGLGVQIRSQRDVIQVPDELQFTVGSRVAVAAWVKPSTVLGNQPIVIKRLNKSTSFSLGIHDGNIEMSVVLSTGTTVISRAPIAAGTFTHVAGMYDGTSVFLLINGQQVGQIFAAGSLRNVVAPIRIGGTTKSQHFDGIIDEVFLSTQAISKEELTALSCIHRPTTFTVKPATIGPVPPGTTVHYDVAVSDNDVGACEESFYAMSFDRGVDPGINAELDFSFQFARPATTVTFGPNVTGSEDADPGVHQVLFTIFGPNSAKVFGRFIYELTEPEGCFVSVRRELMIRDLSVVDDPLRTAGNSGSFSTADAGVSIPRGEDGGGPVPEAAQAPAPATDPARRGLWSFGHLMRELAPTPEDAPAMTERVFRTLATDQVVNGFTVVARSGVEPHFLDPWPRTADGALDLDRAPMTLEAIVNRIDLRDLRVGSGGEGRFVFGVNSPTSGLPLAFTIIFEYNMPARTEADVLEWASLWHGLSSHPFPSDEYNAALETITRRFTARNASPGSVNGSALLRVRTNETTFGALWELRQFDLSPDTGFFRQVALAETPDRGFNGSPTFAAFVNQNAEAIKALVPGATGNTVPLSFEGKNFQAGSVFNVVLNVWSAPGINDPEARFHASMNTCNGCHGADTGGGLVQIAPRQPLGDEAKLSSFLSGAIVRDRFTGQTRTINDLARRRADLTSLVCTPDTTDAGRGPTGARARD